MTQKEIEMMFDRLGRALGMEFQEMGLEKYLRYLQERIEKLEEKAKKGEWKKTAQNKMEKGKTVKINKKTGAKL